MSLSLKKEKYEKMTEHKFIKEKIIEDLKNAKDIELFYVDAIKTSKVYIACDEIEKILDKHLK